jgi:hypothetical protein
MRNCPLCNSQSVPSPDDARKPADLRRRAWRSGQWLLPAAVLTVMPKCPLCVAAYIALFTGVGISVWAARWVQILVLVVCLGSLAYLGVRGIAWRKRVARV